MRVQFDKFYRGFLLVLCVLLGWSVWNLAAQDAGSPTTNSVTASVSVTSGGTNSTTTATVDASNSKPMQTPAWIEKLAKDVPFLKWTLWENELWKYLFSLIYIFLAFYVSKFLDYLTRVWLKKMGGTDFDQV